MDVTKALLPTDAGIQVKQYSAVPRPPRLVDRGGQFRSQGRPAYATQGIYNIQRSGGNWRKIYWDDFFHTVINTRTDRIIFGIFVTYALVIFVFAVAFRHISVTDEACNVGVSTLMEAYIFSVETIMTIGYGAPTNDIFYGGCGSMAVLLTLEVPLRRRARFSPPPQSFSGIFLDCICIGMFFVRFSRATRRANSIIFTQSAVVRKIRGQYYFMFQVCERRKHQLLEAHVRCYAVRHEINPDGSEGALFQTHHMRLQQPDDDVGAYLLMALPQVVVRDLGTGGRRDHPEQVHRIDQWSPFYPQECRRSDYEASTSAAFPDPSQRAIDHENGNRDYNDADFVPAVPTEAQLQAHLERSELEVVVILEGEDSTTSNTMQARYSYTASDIAWNATFTPCVSRTPAGGVHIDFDKFHNLQPAPLEAVFVSTPSVF
ncbi:inward rectifier K channel (IRK-C) family protein [Achlya hypogyna]|uniref:Inward rectifier K channel (IRK-C) family protein n=1 Tax=Achlya hypogyna TaxID=1202772 RepID=A0A1V9Z520_ACHHY|nr:inward rectifier K channel (IRK-C) family protein [Achlya hypogyna]